MIMQHRLISASNTVCHNEIRGVPGRNALTRHDVNPEQRAVPGDRMARLMLLTGQRNFWVDAEHKPRYYSAVYSVVPVRIAVV